MHVATAFVDRDGVINRMRRDYVKSWDEFELLPGAIESLVMLSKCGIDVIVITNQSAIGRNLVTHATVDAIHSSLARAVKEAGGSIRAFLVCPHAPEDRCACRKPAPGLLLRARDQLGVELDRSVVIGDQQSDADAAAAAGCQAILVGTGGLAAAVRQVTGERSIEEAIVLCGGLGTRLLGTLGDMPKAMALVNGRPFIDWLLLLLARHGVGRAVLATGHLGDPLRDHVSRNAYGLEVAVSREPAALGTGGAVRLAGEQTSTSPLLVLNGDSYCRFDVARMAALRARATLWLVRMARSHSFGSVKLSTDGSITSFDEKSGGSRIISAGVYLLERDVFEQLPNDRTLSLEHDVFPQLVGNGLFGVVGSGPFVDIGTPESLAKAGQLIGADLDALETTWTRA